MIEPRELISCRHCQGTGLQTCDCKRRARVEGHPLNWISKQGEQQHSYTIMQCEDCKRVYGMWYEFSSAATGSECDLYNYGWVDPFSIKVRYC